MADVKLINKLVIDSFGKGFRGDYDLTNDIDGSYFINHSNKANQISKRCRYPIPFIFEIWKHAGRFTKGDGSELEVYHQKYALAAEKYSQLYKEATGKEAVIFTGFSSRGLADSIATPN